MSTKHYIDADGNYLGGFGGGALPPDGSIKVKAPKNGNDKYVNGKWVDHVPTPQSRPDLVKAIQALIDGDTVAAQVAMDKLGD